MNDSSSFAPDFFLLGAEKAGTSSLVSYLDQHPQIHITETLNMEQLRTQLDRGRDHDKGSWPGTESPNQLVGQKLAYALRSPSAPSFLHDHFPSTRLVASLRNPVDRAYSSWWMYYQRGDDKRPFEQAVEENIEEAPDGGGPERRDEVPNHVAEGYYAEQIRRYRESFPSDQLHILLFERLCEEPEAVMKELFRFLGVSEDVELGFDRREKPAMGKLGLVLSRFAQSTKLIQLVPKSLRRSLRRLIANVDSDRPELDPSVRQRLTEHFRPHNRELEELIDRDLSEWKT